MRGARAEFEQALAIGEARVEVLSTGLGVCDDLVPQHSDLPRVVRLHLD